MWQAAGRAGSGTARALQATGAWARGAGGDRRAGRAAGGAQARGVHGARGRRGAGAGRAQGPRQARGLGAGHAAWARGLALGSALGALGPFSIRFDSFFFPSHQMNTVHCKIKCFQKKNNIYLIQIKSNKIK